MHTTWKDGEAFETLMSDLGSVNNARFKAVFVRDFASQHGVDITDVTSAVVRKNATALDADAMVVLMQEARTEATLAGAGGASVGGAMGAPPPMPQAGRGPQLPPGIAPPIGPFGAGGSAVNSTGGSMGAASASAGGGVGGVSYATQLQVRERQKELLRKYSDDTKAKELEALRGAPDPYLESGATQVMADGGPAADQLKKKHELWLEANKLPAVPPIEKKGRPLPPPKLQFTAWFVEEVESELQVTSFSEVSEKMRDEDDAFNAIGRVLDKHGNDDLDMNDLVMLDADNPNIKIWSSKSGMETKAMDLFAGKAVERKVYLAPLSKMVKASKLIKEERDKPSPVHGRSNAAAGRSGRAAGGTAKQQNDEGNAGATSKDKIINGYNLFLEYKTREHAAKGGKATSNVDTKALTAEWKGLGIKGQAEWLKEHNMLSLLSKQAAKKYINQLDADGDAEDDESEEESEKAEGGARGGGGEEDEQEDEEDEEDDEEAGVAALMQIAGGKDKAAKSKAKSKICGNQGCTLPNWHKGICNVVVESKDRGKKRGRQ